MSARIYRFADGCQVSYIARMSEPSALREFTPPLPGASWSRASARTWTSAGGEPMPHRVPAARRSWSRLLNLTGGWLLVAAGILLIPLPGPGWLVVGIGLLVLSREVRWARGALVRVERFMRRHGMRTSLRRLLSRSRRERARQERSNPAPGGTR